MTENKIIFFGFVFLILLYFSVMNLDFIHYFTDKYNRLIFISIFLNFFVYRYIVKIILLKTLYQETIAKVDKHIASVYYVLLVGGIGTRKSVNLTAITQMCEYSKINKMNETHFKIRLLLSEYLNFSSFEDYIKKNLDESKVYTDKDYKYLAYKFYKQNYDVRHLSTVIDFESFRNPKVLNILSEYIEIYYYLNYRNSHVLSNTTINSVNTGLNSKPVQESFFQLYRKNDLAHEKYLTIVEDEKGVVDNSRVYARMDKESVQNNDDGKDIHAMLQRHGSKGTNTTLTVSQTEKDVTASRRRLPNKFIEFLKPTDTYIFNIEMMIVDFLKNRQRKKEYKFYLKKMKKVNRQVFLYKIFKRDRFLNKADLIHHQYENYLVDNNKHKKRMARYERINLFFGKYLYLIQYSFLHESEEKLGSTHESETTIKNSFPLMMVYPANITYNRYDSYAFYDVYNERNKSAVKPLSKIENFKDKIMTRVEHERMNYRAINKIYDEIDSQHIENRRIVSVAHKSKNSDFQKKHKKGTDKPVSFNDSMYD